ncbi:MAG: tetratricopeptide repeat protein, partial [Planctomycetes bacterium]|nr:tetratricopeptide repeat protein [Planctomycetota bacterium]
MSLGLLLSMLMAWTAPIARAQSPTTDDDDLRGYHTANGLLSRGLNDLAADEYRRFLDAHPTHEKAPTARYGLAVSLFRSQKYAPALEEIGRIDAAAAFPFATESLALAGQCQLALQQWEQAAKRFESLLRRFPEHDLADDATGLLAEALYRNEKLA